MNFPIQRIKIYPDHCLNHEWRITRKHSIYSTSKWWVYVGNMGMGWRRTENNSFKHRNVFFSWI